MAFFKSYIMLPILPNLNSSYLFISQHWLHQRSSGNHSLDKEESRRIKKKGYFSQGRAHFRSPWDSACLGRDWKQQLCICHNSLIFGPTTPLWRLRKRKLEKQIAVVNKLSRATFSWDKNCLQTPWEHYLHKTITMLVTQACSFIH